MKVFSLNDNLEGYLFINCVLALSEGLSIHTLSNSKILGLLFVVFLIYVHVKIIKNTYQEIKDRLNIYKIKKSNEYIKCVIKNIRVTYEAFNSDIPIMEIKVLSLIDNLNYTFNIDYLSDILLISNDYIEVYLLIENETLIDVKINILRIEEI